MAGKKRGQPEGEWKSKTLAEFKDDKLVWRAELSVAPDGGKFRSLRCYFVNKDGVMMPTKQGITLKNEGSKARFRQLQDLVEALV